MSVPNQKLVLSILNDEQLIFSSMESKLTFSYTCES